MTEHRSTKTSRSRGTATDWQGRNASPLAELARGPLILYPRDTGPALYDAMLAALRAAPPPGHPGPAIAQETRSRHTTLSLVATGLGAALVPGGIQVWKRGGCGKCRGRCR